MAPAHPHGSPLDLATDPVLVRATGAVESEVDGERVLLSPKDFAFFSLAGTGVAVWDMVDGTRRFSTIVSELEQRYDAAPGLIRRETARFVQALAGAGLITRG